VGVGVLAVQCDAGTVCDRREAAEHDLRARLRSVSPAARFAERMRPVQFDVWHA
jgi:hypothetical protein